MGTSPPFSSNREQGRVIVERVVGDLCACFEREAEQAGPGPAQPPDGFIATGVDLLVKTADDGRSVLDQPISHHRTVDIVALAAGCQTDELQSSLGQWAGDVSAKLENGVMVVLVVDCHRAERRPPE